MNNSPVFLTVNEAAEILRMSPSHLRQLLSQPDPVLRPIRLSQRKVLVSAADVYGLIEKAAA